MNSRRHVITLILASLTTLFARAEDAPQYQLPVPKLDSVATIKLDWHDSKRDRDVPAKLYSPKEGAGPFPVIIFSHGLGGSREGYEYLGRHWAGCGYVSVHIQHIGSDDVVWKGLAAADRMKSLQAAAGNISNMLNRPADGTFAIDQVEKLNEDASSPLKGKLNLKAIAISGHSFGGFTTLAMAGQTFQRPLGPPKQFGDPRLKAAIAMSAPAPNRRENLDQVFGSIMIPTMNFTGTKDFLEWMPQTKAIDRRIPYDHMTHSEASLVIFKDGDHLIFSGRGRDGATKESEAQDAAFQKLICAGTTAFWDAYLKENNAAKAWLLDGGYAKLLGDQATFEKRKPEPASK